MPFFDPGNLERWSGGNWNRIPKKRLNGFSIDARTIKDGEFFIAIKAMRDGHKYLPQAMDLGAGGALVSDVNDRINIPQLLVDDTVSGFQDIARNHRKKFKKPVIGITGSCGKTSTKEALAHLLTGSICTEGNLNNHLGVPLTLLKIESNKHQYAVVEAGINHVGDMDELQRMIDPEHVIITMIGASHLEGLGNLDSVAEEKIKLWTEASSNSWAFFPEQCLSFNCFRRAMKKNDNYVVLKEGKPKSGKCKKNEVHFEFSTETTETEHRDSYLLKIWRYESTVLSVSIPRVSPGMASNLALAALVASKLGITDEEISERLPQYRPSALRGNRLQGRGCEYFIDCYNANPASMEDSVKFFQEESLGKKKLYILGGMEELGEESAGLHRSTGTKISLEPEDTVALVGEKASWFASGLMESGASENQVLVLRDLEDARPIVEDFEGNVLFKGSRSNKLEGLVPSWATSVEHDLGNAKC
jgi:UDP-N-acetylmuramoyl-tripeptide--D-alanyl-D-alanine ligase